VAFARIVVGYDGSEAARRALSLVPDVAGPDTDVTVLAVVETSLTSLGPSPLDPADVEEARRTLHEAYTFLEERRVQARAERAVGDPADRILEEARRRDADLVVVGSHGKRLARRLLLGSVSAEVVNRAQCPVLVAR
jgi:nucleotide-binding universal stress UspA family protein